MNQPALYQDGEQKKSIHDVSLVPGQSGSKIAPQSLGEVVRFSELMAKADIALPLHLRGNVGACMAVAMQALEWQMSPFAVASKSYSVKGAIAYEAQLIAAVVNTRSGIKGRLRYAYHGEGQDLTCTVTGVVEDETLDYESPCLRDISPQNSPLWKTDPRQQLGYYSARSWARRHVPEVLLGVYDRDEAQQFQGPDNAKDVTPQTALAKQIAARKADAPTEEALQQQDGFNADFVQQQTEEIQNGAQAQPETIEATPKSPHPLGDEEAAPDNVGDSVESGAAEPERLFPYEIAKELIASMQMAKTVKAVQNTWKLQFEERVAKLDKDDRNDIASIADNFKAFANEKIEQIALDNFCEETLAIMSERIVQPADGALL